MEQDHVIIFKRLKADLVQVVKIVFVFNVHSFQAFNSFFHIMIPSLDLASSRQKEFLRQLDMIPSLYRPGRNLKFNGEDHFLSKENTVWSHTSWAFGSCAVRKKDSSPVASPTLSSSVVELGKRFLERSVGPFNPTIRGMIRRDVEAMYFILFDKDVHNALVFRSAILDNLVWAPISADDVFIEELGDRFSVGSADGSPFHP